MLEKLSKDEKAIMLMLIQGENCKLITEWLNIDYSTYKKAKNSILKKLGIKRITQILPAIIDEFEINQL